ncbi:hypothetical protein DL770_011435 [Monosporascus sp. CRB-9-2]|nr:hypothetical protein DL770_011435 [Monosporascus sp. CRB-9-2]
MSSSLNWLLGARCWLTHAVYADTYGRPSSGKLVTREPKNGCVRLSSRLASLSRFDPVKTRKRRGSTTPWFIWSRAALSANMALVPASVDSACCASSMISTTGRCTAL